MYINAAVQDFISSKYPNYKELIYISPDASDRQYYRFILPQNKALILCQFPPQYNKIDSQIYITKQLVKLGLSAPYIHDIDRDKGFMILDDLGHISLKRYLSTLSISDKKNIYCQLADLLLYTQKSFPLHNLKSYDKNLFLKHASYYIKWYLKLKKFLYDDSLLIEWLAIWEKLLEGIEDIPLSFTHLDLHSENILYLAHEKEKKIFGIIDFQDALKAPYIYDIASLLQDVRVEFNPTLSEEVLKYYIRNKKNKKSIKEFYHIIGLHKALWIKAIFMRKMSEEKNTNYVQYIPNIENIIKYNIVKCPKSYKLAQWLKKYDD